MMRFFSSTIVVFLVFALFPGSSHALRLYSHDDYQTARHKAVMAARAGEHKGALRSLGRLLNLEPDNLGALYDYITVLIWDEQYGKALDLISHLDLEQAPEYVIRSLAIAADHAGRDDTTDMLVKLYLKRYPRVPQSTHLPVQAVK